MRFGWKLVVLLITLGIQHPALADERYTITPELPAWVQKNTFNKDAQPAASKKQYNRYILLQDKQINLTLPEKVSYYRSVQKILTQGVVEKRSRLTLSYDPSYEKVTLHTAVVQRGDEVMDQLEPEKIRVLQRENKLSQNMLNGQQTILVLLENVKVGDIIDFSYSIEGNRPASPQFSEGFVTQDTEPFEQGFYRVIYPPSRPIYTQTFNDAPKPEKIENSESLELVWKLPRSDALEQLDEVPSWYWWKPSVMVSEFTGWDAFVGHFLPIVEEKMELTDPVRAVVDKINREQKTPEDKLLEALRYVEEEIRYVSISLGAKGLVPTAPERTLKLRYGDCKAKSVLLATILRGLGIEAHAALVKSTGIRRLEDFQPMIGLFDHMITYVEFEGKPYWMDATRSHQRGDLKHLTQPDYGEAIVLSEAYKKPLAMSETPLEDPLSIVEETLDYSAGFDKPGTFIYRYVTKGRNADKLREQIAENGQGKYAEAVQEALELELTDAKEVSVDYQDDGKTNSVSFLGTYTIPAPASTDKKVIKFQYTPNLDLDTIASKDTVRTAPIAIPYPLFSERTVHVKLPARFDMEALEEEDERIETDFLDAQLETTIAGNTVTYHSQVRTLVDRIPAKELKSYNKAAFQWKELTQPVSIRMKNALKKPFHETYRREIMAGFAGWILGIITAVAWRRIRARGKAA